jgi:flavorubredoxin
MEPDHSSSILHFLKRYPNATIVASDKAFRMMNGFFENDFAEKRIVVGEGDCLDLGNHRLCFITAPMVHWPEVIMTYDTTSKTLFSADAFGKFGSLDYPDNWVDEARRYYFGIVGKYGAQVQSLLKKIKNLDIRAICSLHGPILDENIPHYLNIYDTWSAYLPEEKGVAIAYTSVYGNTRGAVQKLQDLLREKGVKTVTFDLARCDIYEAVANAFKYDRLILATTTYNAHIFPAMKHFIDSLTERNFQNRKVAFIENGSWAPTATKIMKYMLKESKNLTFATTEVTITSALNAISREQIRKLAEEM